MRVETKLFLLLVFFAPRRADLRLLDLDQVGGVDRRHRPRPHGGLLRVHDRLLPLDDGRRPARPGGRPAR